MSGRGGPTDDAEVVLGMAAGSEAALETLYDRHAACDLRGGLSADIRSGDRRGGRAGDIPRALEPGRDVRPDGRFAGGLAAHDRPEPDDRPAAGGRAAPAARRPVVGGGTGRGRERRRSTASCRGGVDRRRVAPPAGTGGGRRGASSLREAIAGRARRACPTIERTVILLAYQEELSQSEIAERLGWPLGTVKTRTRRALQRLREGLGPSSDPAAGIDVMPVPAGEDR